MEMGHGIMSVCAIVDALAGAEDELAATGGSLDRMSDEDMARDVAGLVSGDPDEPGWDADLAAAGAFVVELLARAIARKDAATARTEADDGGE